MDQLLIRTLVVDDEKQAREATLTALRNFPQIKVVAEVDKSENVISALAENSVELAFLDIEMPGSNGFEIARYISEKYPKIMFIFVTGHSDFALDCYDYEPVDFLVKPVNLLRLERAIKRVEKKMLKKSDTEAPVQSAKIGIHIDGGYQIVDIAAIKYVEKSIRKVYIVTEGGEHLPSKYSLGQLEEILAEHGFFRCHQSYIVSLARIISIQNNDYGKTYSVMINGGENIPLSRNKYSELKELLSNEGTLFY